MSVRVIFFANIREDLGTDSVDIEVTGPMRINGLISLLVENNAPEWLKVLTAENIRIAVNQTIVNGNSDITDGDEIAFFPPVTGG